MPEDEAQDRPPPLPSPVRAAPRPPPAPRPLRWKPAAAALLVIGFVAAAVVGGTALYGQHLVRTLGAEVERSEATMSLRMDEALHLRDELATLGADRTPLDASFAAWARSSAEPERGQRALDFVALAEDAAARHAATGSTSHEAQQVRARVQRLREARHLLIAARAARSEADAQPGVKLAGLFGLVP